MAKPVELSDTTSLASFQGQVVTLVGRVSACPWQHLVDPRESHPQVAYFDVGGDQIVLYARSPLSPAGVLAVTGRVVCVQGRSKRPGKSEVVYREYHLEVDSWREVPGGEG